MCRERAFPVIVLFFDYHWTSAPRAARQMHQCQLLSMEASGTDGAGTCTLTLCGLPAAAPDPHGQPGGDAAGQPAEQAGSCLCASGRQLQWVSRPLKDPARFMPLLILPSGLHLKPEQAADSIRTPITRVMLNETDHTAELRIEAGSQHSWSQSAAGAQRPAVWLQTALWTLCQYREVGPRLCRWKSGVVGRVSGQHGRPAHCAWLAAASSFSLHGLHQPAVNPAAGSTWHCRPGLPITWQAGCCCIRSAPHSSLALSMPHVSWCCGLL